MFKISHPYVHTSQHGVDDCFFMRTNVVIIQHLLVHLYFLLIVTYTEFESFYFLVVESVVGGIQ